MIVKYLELNNYRRFKHVALELPQGIIGIIGVNGVGKSTLVEAMAWALFGNQVEITRTKKGEVKRDGATAAEMCMVKLEFAIRGDNYAVNREIRGAAGAHHAELYVNNNLEASGAKAVTELIQKRLGMDHKSFFASVFARQKELNALSSEVPNARKKLVMRMLNIEFLERVKATIGRDRRTTEVYLDGLRQALIGADGKDLEQKYQIERSAQQDMFGVLERELAGLASDKLEKERSAKKIEQEYEAYTKKYAEYKSVKIELDKIIKSQTKFEAELEMYRRELTKLEEESAELSRLGSKEQIYGENVAEKEKLDGAMEMHHRIGSLKTQLTAAETELKTLKEKERNFTKQLEFYDSLDADIATAESARAVLDAELISLADARSASAQQLKQLEQSMAEKRTHRGTVAELGPDGSCPMCERPLLQHHEFLLNKLESELTALQNDLISLKARIAELDEQKRAMDKAKKDQEVRAKELARSRDKRGEVLTRLDGLRTDLNTREENIRALSSELEHLGRDTFDPVQYEKIKNSINELKSTHERYLELRVAVLRIPKLRDSLKNSENELLKVRSEKDAAESKIQDLGFDEREHERLQNRRSDANRLYQSASQEFEIKSQKHKFVADKLADLDMQLKDIAAKKNQIAGAEDKLSYLSTLEEMMEKFKLALISRIRPILSQYASEFLSKLTEGRYSELYLDEDYEIFIYDNGGKYEILRFSGGEEDIANLSLRLAISRVITESAGGSGINMIILDEIFGSQDSYRKRNIVRVLSELQNEYQQIFLITHVDEMKEQMGFVIDVKADAGGEGSTIDVIS